MRKNDTTPESSSSTNCQGLPRLPGVKEYEAQNGRQPSRAWKLFLMLWERLGERCKDSRGLANAPEVRRLHREFLHNANIDWRLHGLIADLAKLLGAEYSRRRLLLFAVQLFVGLIATLAYPLPASWKLYHLLSTLFGLHYPNAREIHARFLHQALGYTLDKNLGLHGFRKLVPVAHWASVVLEHVDRRRYGGRPAPPQPEFALTREGAEFLNHLYPIADRTSLFEGLAQQPGLIATSSVGLRFGTREATPPLQVARQRARLMPAYVRALDNFRGHLAEHLRGNWAASAGLPFLARLDGSVLAGSHDQRLLEEALKEMRNNPRAPRDHSSGLLVYFDPPSAAGDPLPWYVDTDINHIRLGYFDKVPIYAEALAITLAHQCAEHPARLEACRDKLWSIGGAEARRILEDQKPGGV